MCGLTGFWRPGGIVVHEAQTTAQTMALRLAHRGPDNAGTWVDGEAGIALAHRRLSILDLSPAGHQPMASASARYVISFNGEIYDHSALRVALGHSQWRGHSDTETLLACFEAWGVECTLRNIVGMLAMGLYDREEPALYLARDRSGQNPL